jgi:hypothetical protein
MFSLWVFLVFYLLLLHLFFFFLLLLLKLTPGMGSIVDPPTLYFLCLLLCLFACLFFFLVTLMGNVLCVSWVVGSWKVYLNRMPFRFRREGPKKNQKTGATDKRVGLGWSFASMDLPFSTHRNFAKRGTPI